MAATLNSILAEVKKNTSQLTQIKKRIDSLEKDMKRVLKCVSVENADFKVKYKNNSGGSAKSTIPIAAKGN